MRISDLSRRAGTPVGTIKFYLRERLLPPGLPTGRNQAEYDETHLRRLLLIRAFTNVAHLGLSSIRELLGAIEDDQLPLPRLFEAVERAVTADAPAPAEQDNTDGARADVADLIGRMGWSIDATDPSRGQLVQVLSALQRLGSTCEIDFFVPYAQAVERLVLAELELVPCDGSSGGTGQRAAMVVRSILLEVAMTAMRRMAQEHHAALRFGPSGATARPAREG